jgi:hypothetical protein
MPTREQGRIWRRNWPAGRNGSARFMSTVPVVKSTAGRSGDDRSVAVLWRARAWLRRAAEPLLTAAAMVAVVWFHHWTVEVNSGFEDWGDDDYYRLLVRGWRKGQLSLDKLPSPELLALADPYDPLQNAAHKLGDASLYQGKYYIYFGAAPAFTLMLPYGLLTGREMTTGAAIFVFCSVAFLAASALWLALRRRYFAGSSMLVGPLGVLAIGLGTHLLAPAQRPMFWELAIVSGVAFAMLAAVAAYQAMHGRRPLLAMAAAGLFLGLAVGSRPTWLVAFPLLLPPVLWSWGQRRANTPADGVAGQRAVAWWRMAVAAAVPLGACGLAMMAHNHARFDSVFEFGQRYQLSGAYESQLTHFSLRFLPHNFAVYLFQPLRWEAVFPFVAAQPARVPAIPGYFGTEQVAGLAATFPVYWFLLALPLAWWRRAPMGSRRLLAVVGSLAGCTVPVMALVMCYFSTTMRYETDFAPPLVVLALTGLLALERRISGGARAQAGGAAAAARSRVGVALAGGVTVVSCVATALIGVLLSFDYHERPLPSSAPGTWQRLADAPERAMTRLGGGLGWIEGPRVLKVRFRDQPAGTVERLWVAPDGWERIVVEHAGERLLRFGFARGAAPVEWGRPLSWKENHTHTVELQLPSLYPKVGDGWWRRGGGRHAFRQSTAVAVWFSGGRALELIVDPLPDQVARGGRPGADFSGEVRRVGKRVFRDDEIESELMDSSAPRGGRLWMRIHFPDGMRGEGEPLFSSGSKRRSSILYVRPDEGGVRIGYQSHPHPRVESAVIRPERTGHVVELEMPSFRPDAYGWEGTGEVVVRLDGAEILRSTQVAHPFAWSSEQIGRNFFGWTCGPHFRGWIREAKWLQPPLNPQAP